MSFQLDVEGRSVLLTTPGPRAAETVHALLDAGAGVQVLTEYPDARLVDLASRGLIQLVHPGAAAGNLQDYDLVIRDPRAGEQSPEHPGQGTARGRVILVGGGPGSADLLTLGGLAALRVADVVVTDRLAPLGVLDDLPVSTLVLHVGKIPRGEFTPQETINRLLVEHARAGRTVVRLKGGDNFVFGRGGEEWNACVEAGIDVHVVPGVSSAIAVPALAGIPLTHRTLAQGVVVVSAHVPPDDPRSMVDWAAVARTGFTIVVLMGVGTTAAVADALIDAGLAADTPAAMIADGATPRQRTVRAPLARLADTAHAAGMTPPAVTVIGPVVNALTEPAG